MTPITRLNTDWRGSQVPTAFPKISTHTSFSKAFIGAAGPTSLSVLRTDYMWQWHSTFSHTGGLTEALNTEETLDSLCLCLPPSLSLSFSLSFFKNVQDVNKYCLSLSLCSYILTLKKNLYARKWFIMKCLLHFISWLRSLCSLLKM